MPHGHHRSPRTNQRSVHHRILYGREEIGDEHCAGPPSENDDGHAASSREDHRAASDMREKSETPDDDSSETPRGMIDNRLRF